MYEVNERLLVLRKYLGLSQQKFAERIGASRDVIANIDLKRNAPAPIVISSVCREFRVSRAWLENGTGDMLLPEDEDEAVTRLMLGESERAKHLMRTIAGLPPEAVDLIYSFARALIQRDPDAPHPTDKGGP